MYIISFYLNEYFKNRSYRPSKGINYAHGIATKLMSDRKKHVGHLPQGSVLMAYDGS